VFLDPHDGDLNGFFLLRGDPAKLEQLLGTRNGLPTPRARCCTDGSGVVRGVTGGTLMQRTGLWTKLLPPA
jgi:hypothetical protein